MHNVLIFEALYFLVAAWLAVYGLNALYLALLRKYHQPASGDDTMTASDDWPPVTVQLPVYNERYVIERLLIAVSELDYPRDRLEIQVLDDSDDITSEIIAGFVRDQQAGGLNIHHIQRPERTGFKGGALAHGFHISLGEYIAIFDADFIPAPDTLKRILPHFQDDVQIGCHQARWGHLNPDTSWLTRSQAAGIDGHFLVQQETRSKERLFLNFNGTAGIWRRACIEDSGGWQGDTLTEDLDLSFRAQLRGWRILYLPNIIVPGELPATINAFKRQQFRWAKGSIQTARKLLLPLWRSRQPLRIKLTSTIHLTNYLVHPLILLNLLLTLPILFSQNPLLQLVPLFTIAALGPILMYWIAMEINAKSRTNRFSTLAMLLVMGMGLSLNNTHAVLEALLGIHSSFLRTPKFNIRGGSASLQHQEYRIPVTGMILLEILLALYAIILLVFTLHLGVWRYVFWLPLYIAGFCYIAGLGLYQSIQPRSPQNQKTARIRLPLNRIPSPAPVSENATENIPGD